MKKFILTVTAIIGAVICVNAQNVQLHYDFGHNLYKDGEKDLSSRAQLTSTVEMFKPDSWGSTFFFIDFDYGQVKVNGKDVTGGALGAYWEISRELKFWDAPFSAHIEYNGGLNRSAVFNDAWLVGPTWSWANSDFTKTFSLTGMYKYIPRNDSPHNFQITGVWNLWFFNKKVLFCGFADFWREKRPWQGTDFIFLSEPQIWYNFNTLPGWEKINFSLGSEVEISNNFVGKGFYVIPTMAMKWTF